MIIKIGDRARRAYYAMPGSIGLTSMRPPAHRHERIGDRASAAMPWLRADQAVGLWRPPPARRIVRTLPPGRVRRPVNGHVAAELPSTCLNVPWAMSGESSRAPCLLPSPEVVIEPWRSSVRRVERESLDGDEFGAPEQSPADPRRRTAMLHPDVAYDIAARHGKARLAQAATIAQASAARRARRGSRGRRVCGLLSRVRLSLRPRTG
jgi:hypothetical protein